MGYGLASYEGSIVSWGSANLFSTLLANLKPIDCRVQIAAPGVSATGNADTVESAIPGLGSWTAEVTAHAFATPRITNAGLVTWAGGRYTQHVRSWSIDMSWPALEITEGSATPPTYRSFRPGRGQWGGSFTCLADSATALVNPDAPGTAVGSLVLKYGENTTDETLTGNAICTSLNVSRGAGDLVLAEYSFAGAGNLAAAGTASIFGATSLFPMTWTEGGSAAGPIVIATKTGSRTLTGADSFLSQLGMSVNLADDATVQVSMTIQGSGSITQA